MGKRKKKKAGFSLRKLHTSMTWKAIKKITERKHLRGK